MNTKSLLLSILLVAVILLTACGPSAEQIATMTASAWTPTPKPTNTPLPTATATPVPYDLTVKVTDADGNPIAGALVVFPQSGNEEPVAVDDSGQAAWTDLDGPAGTVTVAAQGYFKGEQSFNLNRGPNEIVLKLERDPFGLLPSDACGAGESLLYVEDYQDGEAQDWRGQANNPGTAFVGPASDEAANSVWTIDATKITEYGDNAWLGANYGNGNQGREPGLFGDAVWRMRFMLSRPTAPSLNWHELANPREPIQIGDQDYGGAGYSFHFMGGQSQIQVNRNLNSITGEPVSGDRVDSGPFKQVAMQWHSMELSMFQGNIQLWIDGKPVIDFTDPEPIPPGGIGIWIGPFTAESLTVMYFDDIRVCGLSAPFASAFVAP